MSSRRRLGAVVTAGLLALTALAASSGGALAGPRVIFLGSPGHQGVLDLSPVEAGGLTSFRLRLQNQSTQTVNHATIRLGDSAPTTGAPSPTSLPAGASIVGVFGDGGACTLTSRDLRCEFGQLASNAAPIDIAVVLDPGSNNPLDVWAAVTINEAGQNTNPDTFWAVGSAPVVPATDDAFGTVIGKGNPIAGATGLGANGVAVGVSVARQSTGADTVAILEDAGTVNCGSRTCFGQPIRLAINFGDRLDPAAQLSITWADKSLKIGGILHQLDDGSVVDIPNTKAARCATASQTNCVVSFVTGRDGQTLTVRIPENGAIKGYR